MAQGKKSFVAYADWKNVFDELPDEDAGKLIKHIFSYVNDENPESDSILIKAVFANIKTTLKRDLEKWESQLEQRREAGKISAEKRKKEKFNETEQNSTNVETRQRNLTSVETRQRNSTDNVSVSVNDSVSDNEKLNKFNFKKYLLDYGFEKNLISEWLQVRKTKKAVNSETAFNGFIREVELSQKDKNEVLKICVMKSWAGFECKWLKTENNGTNNQNRKLTADEQLAKLNSDFEQRLKNEIRSNGNPDFDFGN